MKESAGLSACMVITVMTQYLVSSVQFSSFVRLVGDMRGINESDQSEVFVYHSRVIPHMSWKQGSMVMQKYLMIMHKTYLRTYIRSCSIHYDHDIITIFLLNKEFTDPAAAVKWQDSPTTIRNISIKADPQLCPKMVFK
jgi:hypothetical protein